MRKLALLLTVLALAAMPSVADAAKKEKKAKAKPAAAKTAAAPEPPIVAFFRVGTSAPLNTPGGASSDAGKGKKGKTAKK